MKVTEEEIKKIAHLARLNVSEKEMPVIQGDLNKILVWMDKLNELPTEDVEPQIFMTREQNVLREDKVANTLTHEQALENAPKKDSNYFRVPKTVE